jgi:hypothetical protein
MVIEEILTFYHRNPRKSKDCGSSERTECIRGMGKETLSDVFRFGVLWQANDSNLFELQKFEEPCKGDGKLFRL